LFHDAYGCDPSVHSGKTIHWRPRFGPEIHPERRRAIDAAVRPCRSSFGSHSVDFTDYYEKEMGDILDRVFFSFERLIEADRLPEIKRQTNELEDELAELLRTPNTTIKRPVNLDPGYVEQAKVVLASTKNFYHRIYIGRGIFAEVTMHFKNNTYQFFPWTYPDYQSRDYQEFFLRTRQIFRSQLRTMCIVDNNLGRGGTGQM